MQAPCDKNTHIFFQILDDYTASDLVRLTLRIYEEQEDCFPYWECYTNKQPTGSILSIKVKNREINYFPIDHWQHHQGIEPEDLLALVKNAKISDQKMIAVHCRNGAGRTGTFISAYDVSINKLPMELLSIT